MLISILILILLAALLNKLSKEYSMESLNYKRNFSKTVVEIGEEFEISTILENNKFLPITFLQIREEYPDVIEYKGKTDIKKSVDRIIHRIFTTLMPFQRVKRTYKVTGDRRGRYLIKDVNLITGDFLGFTSFTKELFFLQEVIFLPKRYDIEKNLVPYGDYNGNISVRRWIIEDPILIVGIRDYTGYEPQKTIHWPSSLKSGRMMVKKFDYTTDNRVLIILNIEAFKPFWMNIDHVMIEKCISLTRTLCEDFETQGIPYGFVTNSQLSGSYYNGNTIMPGWGKPHLDVIIESLGRIDYGINMIFEELLTQIIRNDDKYGTCIIITPSVIDSYVENINTLDRCCEKTVVISLSESNLDSLNDNVIKIVERRDEN